MDSHVLLIGIGNEYRSDDSIGLVVAQEIREKQLSSIIVKVESGEGAALMEAWQGFQNVIIVDAVSSGAKPGTIFRIKASEEIVPAKFFHYSTHAFGVAEAIELARAMKVLPPKLVVYGIEGATFTAGVDRSSVVKEAAGQVIEQIMEEIEVINR
jgi:hydrogenase maturation protease